MKGLFAIIITLSVSISSFVYTITSDGKIKINQETIDKLTIQASRITKCEEVKCISSFIKEIKTYNSYVIIYKKKNKWTIDRNFENYNHLLSTYKPKSIYVLEGQHIQVSGVLFTDQKQVVILQ